MSRRQEEMLKALNTAFNKSATIGRIVVNGTQEAVIALNLTKALNNRDITFLKRNGYLVDEKHIRNYGRVLLRLVESYPDK